MGKAYIITTLQSDLKTNAQLVKQKVKGESGIYRKVTLYKTGEVTNCNGYFMFKIFPSFCSLSELFTWDLL